MNLTGRKQQVEGLFLWPYVGEDGLLMVDTSFKALGPFKTSGAQTNLVRRGSRTRLTKLDDQYALWQYVEVMDGGKSSKS